jgi:hypothetical protein
MNYEKYINIYWFIGAFIVGLIYTYLTMKQPEQVIQYPTPENAGRITYKDDAGVCYRYKVVEVGCGNPSNIKNMPIQQS